MNVLIKMSNFRENRQCITYAYRKGFINNRQCVLLYDANTSKNLDFPYWKYDQFDLDELGNDQCKAEFQFYKNDIFKLAEYLQLPDEIVTYNSWISSCFMYLSQAIYVSLPLWGHGFSLCYTFSGCLYYYKPHD